MYLDKRLLFAGIAALLLTLPEALDAQLPRVLRRAKQEAEKTFAELPSLSDLMDDRPITTSFDDADYGVPLLDDYDPTGFRDLTRQKRGPNGEFIVTPGLYAYEATAYCLRAGTPGPSVGDGSLYAPLAGPAAGAVQSIIRGAYHHPEISQRNIQLLLWAIVARVEFEDLSPRLREVAETLLSPRQRATLNRNSIAAIPDAAIQETIRSAPQGVRKLLEADAKLRNLFAAGDATYEDMERVAVLSGIVEDESQDETPPGRWSLHPGGYFVRYSSSTYTHMRVEVSVPERWDVERDSLGRIASLTNATGHRFETEYDDTIEPLRVPGDPSLRGYAFRRIRFVHPDPSEANGFREAEWENQGWTFVSVDTEAARPGPRPPAANDPPVHGPSAAGGFDTPYERPVRQQSARFDGLRGRTEDAWARGEKVRDFKRRWERSTGEPTERAIDNVTDTGHYWDGLKAAISADMASKGEWLGEHLELLSAGFNYLSCKLAGGCGEDDGGAEDETTIDPSNDMKAPADTRKQLIKQGVKIYRPG